MICRLGTVTEDDIARIMPSDIVICSDEHAPQNTETASRSDCEYFFQLIEKCDELNVPLLAQGVYARLLAHHYGGDIQAQPHKAEQGSVTLLRLVLAQEDSWLGNISHEYSAQSFRSDDILQLPLLALPLQNSELTQFQTFKIVGKVQYGVQWYNQHLTNLFIDTYVHQQS